MTDAPPPVPAVSPEARFLAGLLAYRGRGRALLVLLGSSVVAAASFGLITWIQHEFPDRRALKKLAALPLAMAAVVFYIALLQVILGERASSLMTSDEEKEAPVLVLLVVITTFTLFLMVTIGGAVVAFR